MFFEQSLSDVAMQYYFVKNASDFIENTNYYDMPSDEEIIATFKNTAIYQKLSYNINDSLEIQTKKKHFVDSFIEVLNAAGLAIEAIILAGIDNVIAENGTNCDKDLFVYFNNQEYNKNVTAILPTNESPIDQLSLMIANNGLDEKYIDSMREVKHFFLDTARTYQRKFQYLKYDLLASRGFNYKKIVDFILPFYKDIESEEDSDEEDEIDDQDSSQKEKAAKKEKAKTASSKEGKRVFLSVEDAIEKNFDGLIGLKDVKTAILRKTKLIQKLPSKAIDCNFRIVANPGVGKTTVPKQISRTFNNAGILKSPTFVSINGAGLKGKYVGHTVGQVKDIFHKAKGGTLFLDEVYSLLSSSGSEDSYTGEAITQLMIEVENLYKEQEQDPSNKTLVIMAGYKDKIDMLLDKNVGFKRRFSNIIEIKDYTLDELVEIFNIMMKRDGMTISKSASKKLAEILEVERKKKNFSNAGYVRNLLQKAEEYQAGRAELNDLTIVDEDITASSKDLDDSPEENRIGFN